MITKAATDVLSIKIGTRFLVVTVFPTVTFTALMLILLLAGAPNTRPRWETVEAAVQGVTWVRAIAALAGLLVLTAVVHPLNYALIRLAEGYWSGLPLGERLQSALASNTEHRRAALRHLEDEDPSVSVVLDWLPAPPAPILPTTLGNVLYAGEIRAGARYGYDTAVVLPRLMPLLDENVRAQVADTRNQLDVAARIFMLSLIAVPITTILLIRHDVWLLVPAICYALAWISYRSAVAAAKRFCDSLAVVFDLHHLLLWDAMALARPRSVQDAHAGRGEVLTNLLADHHLTLEQLRSLTYEDHRDPPRLSLAAAAPTLSIKGKLSRLKNS